MPHPHYQKQTLRIHIVRCLQSPPLRCRTGKKFGDMSFDRQRAIDCESKLELHEREPVSRNLVNGTGHRHAHLICEASVQNTLNGCLCRCGMHSHCNYVLGSKSAGLKTKRKGWFRSVAVRCEGARQHGLCLRIPAHTPMASRYRR